MSSNLIRTDHLIANGFPCRCERCGKTIAAAQPRLGVFVKVSWFRGDDQEGYVDLPCAVKLCFLKQDRVDKFLASLNANEKAE